MTSPKKRGNKEVAGELENPFEVQKPFQKWVTGQW